MSATVKELLKSDSSCESYARMKKGPVFFLTHSVYNEYIQIVKISVIGLFINWTPWKFKLDTLEARRLQLCKSFFTNNNNNIIIISKTMFMVLSSWQSHCENSPGSFDERRQTAADARPSQTTN